MRRAAPRGKRLHAPGRSHLFECSCAAWCFFKGETVHAVPEEKDRVLLEKYRYGLEIISRSN
jgi:hypothetical protein